VVHRACRNQLAEPVMGKINAASPRQAEVQALSGAVESDGNQSSFVFFQKICHDMEEQHCAYCASPRIVRARRTAFTVVSRCLRCGRMFAHPMSVVLVDRDHTRREHLVSLLRAEGIPVVPVSRVADLERWPVGKVLVTDVAHATRWWIAVGATHVIVLADTDEERSIAQHTGASAMVTSGDPAALLSLLHAVADAGPRRWDRDAAAKLSSERS
jgi:hypothetical protein